MPIAKYATPGDQRLPNTIVPYVKDCNTILLANHGTVSWGPTLELAYFNTEIIDAYCRILLLAKQLGRVNYFSEQHTSELMEFKKRIGYDDPRLHIPDCELCGPSVFDEGYSDFVPEAHAFARQAQEPTLYTEGSACSCSTGMRHEWHVALEEPGSVAGAEHGRTGAHRHRSRHGGAGDRGRAVTKVQAVLPPA